MAQVGLQHPVGEREQLAVRLIESGLPWLRKQPVPLTGQLDALGFDRTHSGSQAYRISTPAMQRGWRPNGKWPC